MEYVQWLKEIDWWLNRCKPGAKRASYPEWDWSRMYRAEARPQDVAKSVLQCRNREENREGI